MSEVTKFFNKSYSVTTDAIVSIVIGGAVFVVSKPLLSFLPFSEAIAVGLAGTLAAMTYIRARKNLEKTDSGLK